jgi:hypothetical protein
MAGSLLAPPAHQGAELVEVVYGVMRAGGGLWVVLDAEGRVVKQPDALDDAVVEVDVADDGGAVRGLERLC